MNKKFKNDIHFFILIVGLIILSHELIPHHHHYVTCHDLSTQNHGDSDSNKHNAHCHYLNEIILDKIVLNNQQSIVKFIFHSALLFDIDIEINNISIRKSMPHSFKNKFPAYFIYINDSPTRGSPLV